MASTFDGSIWRVHLKGTFGPFGDGSTANKNTEVAQVACIRAAPTNKQAQQNNRRDIVGLEECSNGDSGLITSLEEEDVVCERDGHFRAVAHSGTVHRIHRSWQVRRIAHRLYEMDGSMRLRSRVDLHNVQIKGSICSTGKIIKGFWMSFHN